MHKWSDWFSLGATDSVSVGLEGEAGFMGIDAGKEADIEMEMWIFFLD